MQSCQEETWAQNGCKVKHAWVWQEEGILLRHHTTARSLGGQMMLQNCCPFQSAMHTIDNAKAMAIRVTCSRSSCRALPASNCRCSCLLVASACTQQPACKDSGKFRFCESLKDYMCLKSPQEHIRTVHMQNCWCKALRSKPELFAKGVCALKHKTRSPAVAHHHNLTKQSNVPPAPSQAPHATQDHFGTNTLHPLQHNTINIRACALLRTPRTSSSACCMRPATALSPSTSAAAPA